MEQRVALILLVCCLHAASAFNKPSLFLADLRIVTKGWTGEEAKDTLAFTAPSLNVGKIFGQRLPMKEEEENSCKIRNACSQQQLRKPTRKAAPISPVMMGRAAAVRANKKGKTDAAKAKLYSRYGKMVTMCVKAGGPDPVANVQLAKVLDQAKNAGVPKTNMDNAIKKASSKDQADYKESSMEVYAHGGVGFVIDILTDNNNRQEEKEQEQEPSEE
ncbi:hypothetical protein GUITHDRAFT_121359 [Guillardia theta CCMP2712]|uniref:TACO1/YebC-like N-terminal domain-containing protein n=1 Tax=Guillardia theta (strain CCMP2712) TaxID=905079 RepID=L1I873_GUITC|nr:hypothetical protein GUITHDRAFT_121359 [Guillardia theta CCMP2712]EKX32466.1 hypothetical protein GUITHDRAFT_121359 [Guillardia theta CCMP2712]|eukprot:XP_005819446.1 hypothetical protein GUITHDRAFT_121359 [Guillardia theta CCMP2712]